MKTASNVRISGNVLLARFRGITITEKVLLTPTRAEARVRKHPQISKVTKIKKLLFRTDLI
jgi:hypothetical protein